MGFALAPDKTLRILQTQLGQPCKEEKKKKTQDEIKNEMMNKTK